MRLLLLYTVLGLSLTIAPALAAVPTTMSYQGVLTDGSGNIPPDGTHNFTFAIYDAQVGGALLWGPESHNGKQVTRGGFEALLGQGSVPIPLELAFDKPYFLEIAVDGGAPLAPRIALASSPYSLRAKIAEETFAHSHTGATITIGSVCTNYAGGAVTINAPGPGYVVVDSDFWLLIEHTVGIDDGVQVGISDGPANCPSVFGLWVDEVPASEGTNSRRPISGHVQDTFPVSAGPHTFYLMGTMISGASSQDWFWYANMSAIYHYDPSPAYEPPQPAAAKKIPDSGLPAAAKPITGGQ